MLAEVLMKNELSYQNFLQILNVEVHSKKAFSKSPYCLVIFDHDKHSFQKNSRMWDWIPHCLVYSWYLIQSSRVH